jgi:ABC-type sugar transport system ATPase subunit/ribose/xylose/arabinose/galactoside ABC-type transport system permease subunit
MTAHHDEGTARRLAEPPDGVVVLDVRGASKTYTTVPVLRDVSVSGRRGEVLGLLGANGAGKSTLLKIVAGIVAPSAGDMEVNGQRVDFSAYGPRDAMRAGIFIVSQELSVFTNISVAENFAMTLSDRQPRRAVREIASAALNAVFPGNGIAVRAETGSLSLAERQMVEIAIAASRPGLSVLIMDEPTSALPATQAEQLHAYLRVLKEQGVLIIYVTHKLDEILDIADRLVVLRDGGVHWEGDPATITREQLLVTLGARAMESPAAAEPDGPASGGPDASGAGGHPAPAGPASRSLPGHAADRPDHAAAVLAVRGSHPSAADGIRLHVDAGEIVGIAGLEGAGQRALLREIYATGSQRRAAFAVTGGAGYVSGDRKREGLFALWSIGENIVIASISRLARYGFVRRRAVAQTVGQWYQALHIVAPGPQAPVAVLSGGNQQKTIIARGLASGAALLLLDDPTRGVDIETKTEFYRQLGELLYSTEDREFSQCDRVYVMARGRIVAELQGPDRTRENIIHWSYAGADLKGELQLPDQRARAENGAPARAEAGPAARALARVAAARSSRLAMVLVLLVAMLIAMQATQPSSLTTTGLNLLLGPAMPLVLAALAQMLVIMGGDFDVSIGFAIGLANVISATTLVTDPALGVLMLLGMIAGYCVMAMIVELAGVPSIVVTLGASFIWLGCGLVLQPTPGGTAPSWLATPLNASLQLIPLDVYICAGLAAITWYLLRRWRYGVALRGFGNNRQAFIETGRSALRARITIYALAGALVVLAGLLTTAATTGSDINASSSLTLVSVAAVVIGGAEFSGGIVEPVGSVLAALALGLIPSFLYFVQVSPNAQTAVEGLLLVLAMIARRFVRRARI